MNFPNSYKLMINKIVDYKNNYYTVSAFVSNVLNQNGGNNEIGELKKEINCK